MGQTRLTKTGFDSRELILLSLTYRRYLYLRTLCFGG